VSPRADPDVVITEYRLHRRVVATGKGRVVATGKRSASDIVMIARARQGLSPGRRVGTPS
jgi:hypothetical protein